MTISEYAILAQRTSNALLSREDHYRNGVLGLVGELGEALDVMKKWKMQSTADAPMPKDRIIDEIGDVMWYAIETCASTGSGFDELETVTERFKTRKRPVLEAWTDAAEQTLNSIQRACSMWRAGDDIQTLYDLGRIAEEIDLVLGYIGTDMSDCLSRNIEKLKARYPDGFDPIRSANRAV